MQLGQVRSMHHIALYPKIKENDILQIINFEVRAKKFEARVFKVSAKTYKELVHGILRRNFEFSFDLFFFYQQKQHQKNSLVTNIHDRFLSLLRKQYKDIVLSQHSYVCCLSRPQSVQKAPLLPCTRFTCDIYARSFLSCKKTDRLRKRVLPL